MKYVAKIAKINCIHVQKHKKRGPNEDIFHYIAQYSICIMPITYNFTPENKHGTSLIQNIRLAYLTKIPLT